MRRVTQDSKSQESNLECVYFIFCVTENDVKWKKTKTQLNA